MPLRCGVCLLASCTWTGTWADPTQDPERFRCSVRDYWWSKQYDRSHECDVPLDMLRHQLVWHSLRVEKLQRAIAMREAEERAQVR